MAPGSKYGLTKALEELTKLLPTALDSCPTEPESQSSLLIIEKLRDVLLDLLNGCATCSTGKHITAVLKILKLVLDKLPATFSNGACNKAVAHMVVLLGRLPAHLGTVDQQLLAVWCSMSSILAEQDQQLLLEMHTGTVDLLFDLEQLLFELSNPSIHAAPAGAGVALYQGLLAAVQLAGQQQQQQQNLQDAGQQQPDAVHVAVKDEQAWKAYVTLGLRFLVFLLEEFSALLGPLTPCALVPALGQILCYGSSDIQELCLNAMTLMVIHQGHEASMVSAVLQQVLWLLECAVSAQLPADLCTPSWQVAAAACITACATALEGLQMLDSCADMIVAILSRTVTAQSLRQQQCLWLGLLQEALQLCPSSACVAALELPFTVSNTAAGSAGEAVSSEVSAAADSALLQVWQLVGQWTASSDVRGIVERQLSMLYPSAPSAPAATASPCEQAGDHISSPAKKKPRKNLKQAKLEVLKTAEGGMLSSQRPEKSSSSQPSQSGQTADTASRPANTQPSPAEQAVAAMQQLLQLQPSASDAAAVARICALIASLGPSAPVPASLAVAMGLDCLAAPKLASVATSTSIPQAVISATDMTEQEQHDLDLRKIRLLQALLQGLFSVPGQSPALVACISRQIIAWLPRAHQQRELCSELLPVLLLAMVLTAYNAAAEPSAAEVHMPVWQQAVDRLQGSNSLYASGAAGPPSPLLAASSAAWLTLSRLLGWGGSAAVTAATTQVHAGCTSADPACAVAALLLLPIVEIMQHAQFDDPQQQLQQQAPAGVKNRKQQSLPGVMHQHPGHVFRLGVSHQQVLSSFTQAYQALGAGCTAAPIQLAAMQSVSLLLQACTGTLSGVAVAACMQDAAHAVLRIHPCCSVSVREAGSSRPSRGKAAQKQQQHQVSEAVIAELLSKLLPYQPCLPTTAALAAAASATGSTSSTSTAVAAAQLPGLITLLPILQPAFSSDVCNAKGSSGNSTCAQVQVAALQLLNSYLQAAPPSRCLAGGRQLLLEGLGLITSPANAVRDAALELVQQYGQPAVLHEAFGASQQQQPDVAVSARRLLEHLRDLLNSAGASTCEQQQQQQQGRQHERGAPAQLSLLRVIAGLYEGMSDACGCAEVPLLYLLEQTLCQHAQVSATALELLQHLAARHTASKELEELLVQGPSGPALLEAVGKALATQPDLFAQLARTVQVPESQLAASVALGLVPWLCQQQLTEPLELLASKLGTSAQQLVLLSSDSVLAECLWHQPDSLARYMEWVEGIMAPHTFLDVVKGMGRKMTRCIIYKAGSACFWGAAHQPTQELLARAQEYVGLVANGMEMNGPDGLLQLLQGETIALLSKHIGNTLSKELKPEGAAESASQSMQSTSCAGLGCEALSSIVQPILQQNGEMGVHQMAAGSSGCSSLCVSAGDKMQCLRALVVLMHLLGAHVGTHAYQMMAVLSEALMYCTEGAVQMQALSAWLTFVQLLAAHAPAVLQRVAAQAAVVLLPVLELAGHESSGGTSAGAAAANAGAGGSSAGEVDAAAVKLAALVLHEIVVRQRQHVRAALQNMPPLPSLEALKEVNAVLAQEQHRQGPLQQLQLLISALQHESIAVRHVGLGEVRSFLLQHKNFISDAMAGLLSCSGPAALPQDGNKPGSAVVPGPGVAHKGANSRAVSKNGTEEVKLAPDQCRELFSELLSALLASCDNLPRMGQNLSQARLVHSMKQRCAQCLGLLGAIDPAHVRPELPRPAPFAYRAEDCLRPLVQQHLVRVLQTACDIGQLEVTSYAIQQLLQRYNSRRLRIAAHAMKTFRVATFERDIEIDEQQQKQQQQKQQQQPSPPSEPGSLFSLLDEDVQSIVKPFLTTRFITQTRQQEPAEVVFGSHPHTFRRWLHLWLKQLSSHSTGPLSAAFEACRGLNAWDMPLMMFLLPFMMVEVAGQSQEGLTMIIREMAAVMEYAANPEGHIADIELYVQCIFTQLDLLQHWLQEQQQLFEKAAAQQAGDGRSAQMPSADVQLPQFLTNVQTLITAIPIETRAQAALRCGSYARALQYFETYVRDKHGGGLNPAAFHGGCTSYNYDDVSFLLEVYGQLEEPDGLAGLVQLRQGGLTTSDQILVAEKAGAWSEALSLYELALSQEAAAAAEEAAAAGNANAAASPRATVALATAGDALIQAARAVAAGQSSVTGAKLLAGQRQLPAGSTAAVVTPAGQFYHGLSSLQIGQLRCLLQMGHHQTLLHQVDGLMAKCLASGSAAPSSGLGFDSVAAVNPDTATLGTLVPGGFNAAALQGLSAGGAQWWVTQLAALGLAAAWRLGAWGVLRGYLTVIEAAAVANVRPLSSVDRWEVCVGTLLEAVQRGAYSEVLIGVGSERAGVLGLLPAIAGESYARAYPDLLKLHMLQELEDACTLMQRPQPVGPLLRARTLRWQERLQLTAPLLSCREPLLSLRRQLAGLMADSDAMGKCWLQHAKLCRSTGHQEAAETSVLEAQARAVPGALLERCRLLWDRDKGHRAVMELQLVVQQAMESDAHSDHPTVQHQRAKEMLQLTEWMTAVGQGHKDLLCANYEDAIQLDGSWEKAHFSYAVYLDNLYRDAKLREGKPVASKNDRLGGRSRVRTQEDSPLDYLPQALEHYGESIRLGHKHILQSLPRLLTLYFEFGSKVAGSKTINQKLRNAHTQVAGVMRGLIRNIPTYKWLLVLPQLTSRIYHPLQDVQEFIQSLLGAIVDHFPQQALWAMAMVCKSTVRARQEAAATILAQAKRRSGESGRTLFDNFTRLTDQLIKTCMWQPPSDRRITKCSAFKEFKHLVALLPNSNIEVPVQALFTVDLPPGGKLPPGHRPVNNQTTLQGMKDEVLIMSSLMKPKKITFIGSDGQEYPFLAKPKDDLRKDYRLMDFAGTLNALFARQPQALRRSLSLRTYAVLPLTDDCGILQWVNNLVPFKSACEEIYAKEKLYSRHSTPHHIKKIYDTWTGGNRAQLLDKVIERLPPRLGKWLLARFAEPGAWLAARLAFTRTNAAWAMVGHVLGLGDRHGDNIMIHGLTGETMHVDFGCLFDKGLTLEVPEMVPFRLTQNVVDAFGVSGVEGAFRRAAEMTLQVLRDNKATLMTCAETFLHDPLVDWARVKTSGSSAAAGVEAENLQAKDALFVMEGRLSGTLLGVAAIPSLPLSCEGQAARLIEEASDHENLGKMYIWWMPWL